MTTTEQDDPVWRQAVEWTLREHEGGLTLAERETLLRWLTDSPQHREAYDEAAKVWLITGLVPPSADDDDPCLPSRDAGA